jgi:hypothetical protein
MNRSLLPIGPLAVAVMLCWSGCAAPTQTSAMVGVPQLGSVHQSPSSLAVSVMGGRETSAVGASQISNQDFAQALKDSIGAAGLFSKIGAVDGSRYQLNAFISRLNQPMMGFSMTVTMEVSYTLVDSQAKKTIWEQSITSEHTASAGEAFAGVTRLRLATEGAARQNIESLIRELAKLNLE